MKTRAKRYDRMTAAELHEATAAYDGELPAGPDGLPGRPLTRAEQSRWDKARKKMGRPTIGKGVKRVMISVEAELLAKSDDFAREHRLSRSQMVSQGLRKMMAG